MATLLSTFLSEASRRGFARGHHDCMLFAADWVRTLSGVDPAAAFREIYGTAEQANVILARAGGAEDMIDACLVPLGWRKTLMARAGDVVLVAPPGHEELAAGVMVDGRRSALLSKRGLVIWPLPIVAAWRSHG